MDPIKKKPIKENLVYDQVKRKLEAMGWLVEKTHGSMYQIGWPDLFILHPEHGSRWVELKRPRTGRLKPSQEKKFRLWSRYGVGVWIMTGPKDYEVLFQHPNWHWWLDSKHP